MFRKQMTFQFGEILAFPVSLRCMLECFQEILTCAAGRLLKPVLRLTNEFSSLLYQITVTKDIICFPVFVRFYQSNLILKSLIFEWHLQVRRMWYSFFQLTEFCRLLVHNGIRVLPHKANRYDILIS